MAGEIDPKAAEELAKSVQAIKASTVDATRAFEDQLRIITQMRDVMTQMAGNLDGMTQQGQQGLLSPDGWEQVSKQIKTTTENTSKAAGVMEKLGKIMKSPVTTAAIALTGAFVGMVQGFKNLFALGKGVGGVLGSLADTAFSVGKAIISIPFKLLDGLIGMASKGGDNSYAVALEEVRDQFGSLKSESSRAVLDIAHNMDKMNETGVSAYSIFGNMAERVKAVNELAKGMGNTFQVFQKEIEQNGTAIMMYQRGLGLTDEQMQSVASTAMRMGKGVADVQNEMTKQAVGMSKAFGLNAKVLSKDMGKAMQDLAHFGHLSSKEMAVSAAFAQKLGVSVDKLTGIMDATSTYDQAAEGMSKLNEQFGTNIDATKMMMAQTPQEKIEMLRKEFAKTGKSLESMNMQERMLIKQSSGMSDEMLNAALSSKNAGVSLDKLNKQGDKNEKQTMSQAEAMHELADSIKKIPQSGAQGGSFLDHIINGFSRGVQASPEFMKLMRNIQQALREATMFGVKLGRMFVDLFPGVKDVFGGLGDIFNPARFRKMFGDVMKTFDVFKAGGSGKMEDFMDRIKEVFLNFFNTQEGAGQKVLGGFKKFGEALATIFGKISEWVINKLSDVIVGITDWLKAPPGLNVNTNGLVDGIKKPFDGALTALSSKLWPALKDFASTLTEKMITAIKESDMAKKILMGMAAVVMGPAIMGLAGSLMTAGVMKKAGSGIMSGLAGATTQAAKASSVGGTAAAAIGAASDSQKVGAASEAMQQGLPSEESKKSIERASKSNINWPSAVNFVVGLAGFYVVSKKMFEATLAMVKGVSIGDILAAGAVMEAISVMMIPAATAMQEISKVGDIDLKSILKTLFGLGLMMAEGLGIVFAAIIGVKKFNVTAKDLAVTGLLFLEVGGVLLLAGGIAKIAEKVGGTNMGGALKGLVAMGLVVAAMAATAGLILWATKSVAADRLKAVGDMMLSMSETFAIAGIVIGEAVLIGAATNPVTGALAAVGLGVISLVVGAMALTAIGIIKSLDAMPVSQGIEAKTKAFADVMNSVSNLAGQVSTILKSMDFGLFESQESKAKRMGLVNTMIKTLLNGDDNKGGLQGIITAVIEGIKTITPDKIASASALANILNAASGMMSSMTGKIAEIQNESTHWYSITDKAEEQVKVMNGVGSTISSMMTGLSGFITTIVESLSKVENPEAFSKAAPAIGSILAASGGLISTISPKMKDFQKETSGSLSFSKSFKTAGVDAQGISAMADGVKTILDSMKDSIPALISAIATTTAGIDDKQLKKLPIIIDIIKAVSSFTAAAGAVGGSKTTEIKDGDKFTKITENMPTLNSLIASLQEGLPAVVSAMVKLVSALPKGFSSKIGGIKEITTAMAAVTELMTALNDPFKGVTISGANSNRGETVLKRMRDLRYYLDSLSGAAAESDDGALLPNTLRSASGLVTASKKFMGEGLVSGIKTITEAFAGLGALMTSLNDPFAGVTAAEAGKNRGETVLKRLGDLKYYIDLMAKNGQNDSGIPALLAAATNLKNNTIKEGSVSAADFKGFTTTIKTIVESVNGIFNEITSIQDSKFDVAKIESLTTNMAKVPDLLKGNFTGVTKTITTKVQTEAASALEAVKKMVKITQDLDSALTTLPTTPVTAKLEAVAKAAGLGGKGVYTVNGKDVVIHVELNVTMSADEVERVIISRKSSIIRDRINYAINKTPGDKNEAALIRPSINANDTKVAPEVGL